MRQLFLGSFLVAGGPRRSEDESGAGGRSLRGAARQRVRLGLVREEVKRPDKGFSARGSHCCRGPPERSGCELLGRRNENALLDSGTGRQPPRVVALGIVFPTRRQSGERSIACDGAEVRRARRFERSVDDHYLALAQRFTSLSRHQARRLREALTLIPPTEAELLLVRTAFGIRRVRGRYRTPTRDRSLRSSGARTASSSPGGRSGRPTCCWSQSRGSPSSG